MENNSFSDSEIVGIIDSRDETYIENLYLRARKAAKQIYGNKIYLRALIEISNYCVRDCFYCGIGRSMAIERYRLTEEEILSSCDRAYKLGFRTFVLQCGEDPFFTDVILAGVIGRIKALFPDTRVTLSLGVRTYESYRKLKAAGADRYLLRHEVNDERAFSMLHDKGQSLAARIRALTDLRKAGFVIGTGFMVQAPYTGSATILKDIKLIRQLKPEMIGIGPFIPASGTRFENCDAGTSDVTTKLLAILRIENPRSLIPSTTALNSLDENGMMRGILAGANVVMPNLSPDRARKNYTLYNNKRSTGLESGDGVEDLNNLFKEYGYEIEVSGGDNK